MYHAATNLVFHDGIEHAGYMSFIVLFAIFPFVIFILAFCGFLGASDWGKDFLSFVVKYLPLGLFSDRMEELLRLNSYNLLNLAGIGIIWTISSFVECLRTILNRIYCIKNYPHYLLRRLLSIVQFLLISILLIFIIVIFVFTPILVKHFTGLYLLIEEYKVILFFFRHFFLFMSLFTIISCAYYIIPNNKMSFLEILPGSFLAVVLWLVSGKLLFAYIVYYSQLNFIYGSLGSILVTMMFFYIVNIIIIYGAEFNYLMSSKK